MLQVVSQEDRAAASEAAADRAEDDASVAMRSAETGVREEMEAAAVVKETQSALSKALAELTFLETSYEEKEFESEAQKNKAKEKAQKEAQAAVKDALAAVNSTVQGPATNSNAGERCFIMDLSHKPLRSLLGIVSCRPPQPAVKNEYCSAQTLISTTIAPVLHAHAPGLAQRSGTSQSQNALHITYMHAESMAVNTVSACWLPAPPPNMQPCQGGSD